MRNIIHGSPNVSLSTFLQVANKNERERVAELAHTSLSYLYQIAGKHRVPSPEVAMRIEIATETVAQEREPGLRDMPSLNTVRKETLNNFFNQYAERLRG